MNATNEKNQRHQRALEAMYLAAPINAFYRPTVRIDDDVARVEIDVDERMHHAVGATHGSVAFKLLDDSAIFAAGSAFEPQHLPPTVRPAAPPHGPQIPGTTLADLTRHAILETLKACGGSTTRAAATLQISARMIQYKLHQYRSAPRSALEPVLEVS